MKHHRRLAVAGAVAATMLPGTLLLAMPAVAVPDPGGSEASRSSASEVQLRRSTPNSHAPKAQIEYARKLGASDADLDDATVETCSALIDRLRASA